MKWGNCHINASVKRKEEEEASSNQLEPVEVVNCYHTGNTRYKMKALIFMTTFPELKEFLSNKIAIDDDIFC